MQCAYVNLQLIRPFSTAMRTIKNATLAEDIGLEYIVDDNFYMGLGLLVFGTPFESTNDVVFGASYAFVYFYVSHVTPGNPGNMFVVVTFSPLSLRTHYIKTIFKSLSSSSSLEAQYILSILVCGSNS